MELDVPEFGAHILRIMMCSWLIVSFIRMKSPTLSLLINFALKPILLEIRTVMLVPWLHLLRMTSSILLFSRLANP